MNSKRPAWRVMLLALWIGLSLSVLGALPASGQAELERKVKNRVAPTYPALARRMNIQGVVRLRVVVSPNGNLKECTAVGGNPILVNAAQDAVRKWKFETSPEESVGTVEFRFQPGR